MSREWVWHGKRKVQVYGVVRVDDYLEGEDAITVMEVLPTPGEAKAEVERLNLLNADKHCHYFYLATRFYPDGRVGEATPG